MTDKNLNFSMVLENHVIKTGLSYMDALIDLCEVHEIDLDSLRSSLNVNIRDKIELEAKNLYLMMDNEITPPLFE